MTENRAYTHLPFQFKNYDVSGIIKELLVKYVEQQKNKLKKLELEFMRL